MKIYITRHGESISNADGYIAYPHTGLSKKGFQDAKALGKRLTQDKIKIDAIYCSTLYRALQTLDQILQNYKIDPRHIFTTHLITEIDRFKYRGRPSAEYYADRDKTGGDPDNFKPDNCESESDVKKRAVEFKKMVEKDNFRNILVISHGHFLNHFVQLYSKKGFKGLGHLTGASLSVFDYDGKQVKNILWNDSSCSGT